MDTRMIASAIITVNSHSMLKKILIKFGRLCVLNLVKGGSLDVPISA